MTQPTPELIQGPKGDRGPKGDKGDKGDPGLSISAVVCVDVSASTKLSLELVLVPYMLLIGILLATLAVSTRLIGGLSARPVAALPWLAVVVVPAVLVAAVVLRFPNLGIVFAALYSLAIVVAAIVLGFRKTLMEISDLKTELQGTRKHLDNKLNALFSSEK